MMENYSTSYSVDHAFNKLPDHLLIEIFIRVPISKWTVISSVNKQWATLFRGETLWHTALVRTWPSAGHGKRWPGPIPRGLSKRRYAALYVSKYVSFDGDIDELVGHTYLFLKEQLELSTSPPSGILHGTIIDQFIACGKSRDKAHKLASQIWLAVINNLEENEHTFILLKSLAQEGEVFLPYPYSKSYEVQWRVFEKLFTDFRDCFNHGDYYDILACAKHRYTQNGFSDKAITVFRAMKDAGIEPDKITMVSVLSACASVGALDLGTWIDTYAAQKGLRYNIYIGTGLINMYAKCGRLECAYQVFDRMPVKNVVSWNAMISALAMHGRGKEALSLFTSMEKDQIVHPDDITFVGVLSACVHAGLVDEGLQWFRAMDREFRVIPKIEHYSCVVDLLGRAGRLVEAWEFVEAMPGKPDAVVLGALLGACRNLENVDLGERVAHRLLELEPQNSGNYVILSKMYANSKRWDDCAKMRGLMRERRVIKTPGCSWIEMENQVHEFHAGDFMHFRSREIREMINILNEEMKLEGYKPNLTLLQ